MFTKKNEKCNLWLLGIAEFIVVFSERKNHGSIFGIRHNKNNGAQYNWFTFNFILLSILQIIQTRSISPFVVNS